MKLAKFVDELPIPAILKPRWMDAASSYYEVKMTECKHSFHRDLKESTVWSFEGGYPGPTLEVESDEKVYIKWINDLPAQHLLPVDYSVHGAHKDVPEVRTVVHVHGACVEWESDGYPEAWFTKGFEKVGPYFRKQVNRYDNCQRACTLWYHDHALGITRLNMYAGLAGFYLIRDQRERSLNLPSGKYEVPLMIQDKTFHPDGSLSYPKQLKKPVPELETSIVPEFFGDTLLVNGKVFPFLKVEPRKYRLRFLNAANSRFFRLKLDSGQRMYLIATERGFMQEPVGVNEILLSPAERAEVIIDFTNLEGKHIIMKNDAPAAFPAGEPVDEDTGTVMQFQVVLPLARVDTSVIPAFLMSVPRLHEQASSRSRFLTLDTKMDSYGREWMLLDNKSWDAPISENPKLGSTEIWYLINLTKDSHPIHIHLIDFQVVDRRDFDVDRYKREKTIHYTGPAHPPEPHERGWKDTVRADPKQVTRMIMRFGPFTGLYVWHCHMLEHEDYEMMRPFIVIR
ncbi:multicopper oxidase family protein [Neobacillus drentensis]|uniref:multicopper oxidase family protein n=1 Tax=Neobacillus drentensis TaxID=220684 RepID=UPI002FFF5F14